MSIDDVLEQCAALDIRIHIHDGLLRVTNADALTQELRAGLKQHKAQLVRELSLPLIDYVFLLLPGAVELDVKGKKIKQELTSGGLF